MDDARITLNLDIPVFSTRLRKLSQAFFNAQNGEKVDLMNDWEIGGTQNKWVCPSDRHLQLRAQLKSGWSVRTATARSPTNSKATSGITDAEQEQIRQVLAKAEASKQKEQQRLGKMVDRLDKMRRRATGNGVTHCLLCHTEFGLLASKSYAAMCSDCRKYVCQRNCGVETLDPTRGEVVFLCKICSEAREVLWKKSGAWFYKEMPDYTRPDQANGTVLSPPQTTSSWSEKVPRRHITPLAQEPRSKSPRPRIQPSWVKEKIMSSMSVDDDDKSSSDGEFAQSGILRKPHKQPSLSRREANLARFALHAARVSDSDEESSPESHVSTSTTSPRRSLATPSSYDSHKDLRQSESTVHEDAKSIDSGVVQSDHSNPQAALTLSVSSLAPLAHQSNEAPPTHRISQSESLNARIAQSTSGTSLVTPPPIPARASPTLVVERQYSVDSRNASSRNASISSAASNRRVGASNDSLSVVDARSQNTKTESPTASFMSSPDDDSKNRHRRHCVLDRIDTSQLTSSVSIHSFSEEAEPSLGERADTPTSPSVVPDDVTAEPGAPSRRRRPRASGLSLFSCFFSSRNNRTLGSIQFSLTYSVTEKTLTTHLIRARNLKAMDSNGFSDPYVKLHLLPGNAKATKMTSKTIEKTLNPEWDEELTYHGVTEEDKLRKTLRVTVLDRDRIGSDFLGETRIALKKLPHNQTKKFNLYLEHAIPIQQSQQEEEKERGKILVAIQYNIQQGSLYVSIKRCAELLGMDSTGFSDPYCKVSLMPVTSKNHRQKTTIKKRTLNPEFNETLTFVVPFKDLPKKTLQIGVYDHDLGRHDDYIGGLLLSTAAKEERGRQWINCIENPGQVVEAWHKLELDN